MAWLDKFDIAGPERCQKRISLVPLEAPCRDLSPCSTQLELAGEHSGLQCG